MRQLFDSFWTCWIFIFLLMRHLPNTFLNWPFLKSYKRFQGQRDQMCQQKLSYTVVRQASSLLFFDAWPWPCRQHKFCCIKESRTKAVCTRLIWKTDTDSTEGWLSKEENLPSDIRNLPGWQCETSHDSSKSTILQNTVGSDCTCASSYLYSLAPSNFNFSLFWRRP